MRVVLLGLFLGLSVSSWGAAPPKGGDLDLLGDYAVIHNFAHGGAGALAVVGTDLFLQLSPEKKYHPMRCFLIETGVAAFFGTMKELADQQAGGKFNHQQLLATVAGGALVSATINFQWRFGRGV